MHRGQLKKIRTQMDSNETLFPRKSKIGASVYWSGGILSCLDESERYDLGDWLPSGRYDDVFHSDLGEIDEASSHW